MRGAVAKRPVIARAPVKETFAKKRKSRVKMAVACKVQNPQTSACGASHTTDPLCLSAKQWQDFIVYLLDNHKETFPSYKHGTVVLQEQRVSVSSALIALSEHIHKNIPQWTSHRSLLEAKCKWASHWAEHTALPLAIAKRVRRQVSESMKLTVIAHLYPDSPPGYDDVVPIDVGLEHAWLFRPYDWILKCAAKKARASTKALWFHELGEEGLSVLLSLPWIKDEMKRFENVLFGAAVQAKSPNPRPLASNASTKRKRVEDGSAKSAQPKKGVMGEKEVTTPLPAPA